jgi:hypothetical protein
MPTLLTHLLEIPASPAPPRKRWTREQCAVLETSALRLMHWPSLRASLSGSGGPPVWVAYRIGVVLKARLLGRAVQKVLSPG